MLTRIASSSGIERMRVDKFRGRDRRRPCSCRAHESLSAVAPCCLRPGTLVCGHDRTTCTWTGVVPAGSTCHLISCQKLFHLTIKNLGEEQRVEPVSLRAVRTTPCFRQERFILFRKWNGLEAQVHVLFNPRLQSAGGYETAFCIVGGKIAVEAMGERRLLHIGNEFDASRRGNTRPV